jgi:hypothetical protein
MPPKKPVEREGRAKSAGSRRRGVPRRDAVLEDPAPKSIPREPRARERAAPEHAAPMEAASAKRSRTRGATPVIVMKAASILEEEVAMGIGAAKRIEQRFLDVDALRAEHPDAVMSRFRRDAHDAVDIILDVVTAAATTVGDRAGHFVNVTASRLPGRGSSSTASVPSDAGGTRIATVRIPGRVAPGEVGELTMSLENESDTSTTAFTLHAAELVSASGARIPAAQVSFVPPSIAVAARSTGQVLVRVTVPATAPPGTYEGLIRATQLDALRAILSVQVG